MESKGKKCSLKHIKLGLRRWLRQESALPDKGGAGVWIHSTHVNARQFWQAVYNPSPQEAETGEALEQAASLDWPGQPALSSSQKTLASVLRWRANNEIKNKS